MATQTHMFAVMDACAEVKGNVSMFGKPNWKEFLEREFGID